MLQPSDSLATYLKTMGYSGSVNDMLYAYLISINGLTFGSISLNDLIHRTLVGWGYTGTLSDMIASFMAATAGGGLANYPRSLFSANEQGIWLDPSDFSTLFQDAAGTTPVTAVGQPVGLALDKSKGLVLGAELLPSFDFTNWTNAGSVSSKTANSVTTSAGGGVYKAVPGYAAGKGYKLRLVGTTSVQITVRCTSNSTGSINISVGAFDVTLNTQVTFNDGLIYLALAGAGTATFTSISLREIAGNHAYQTTSASRPTLQQDSNGLYYLSFDGTDDGMATPSIDFTGTDKMTAWAGVRKLSDAAAGIICELSADRTANNGAFSLVSSGAPSFLFASKGTLDSTNTVTGNASPISRVLTGIGDIAGDKADLRVNGSATPATTDQGTGNYGNYPLYIGRRGGSSLPHNGRIYQLIIRGAASNVGQIAAGEAWCNSKTRAY